MCVNAEPLTRAEATFIRDAFANPDTNGGLNQYCMVQFSDTAANREAWRTLSVKVRKQAGEALVLCWRRMLAVELKRTWYRDYSDAAIAEELCVDPAQLTRWRQSGIPITALLQALYLTERWKDALPHPTGAAVGRAVKLAAMRVIHHYLRQASAIMRECPIPAQPWHMALCEQVIGHAKGFSAAGGVKMNRTFAFTPIADAAIGASLNAFIAERHADFTSGEDSDLVALRSLAGDPARVETCLQWLERGTQIVYFWAISALESEMFYPR